MFAKRMAANSLVSGGKSSIPIVHAYCKQWPAHTTQARACMRYSTVGCPGKGVPFKGHAAQNAHDMGHTAGLAATQCMPGKEDAAHTGHAQ
jgi:hypothetical protein